MFFPTSYIFIQTDLSELKYEKIMTKRPFLYIFYKLTFILVRTNNLQQFYLIPTGVYKEREIELIFPDT